MKIGKTLKCILTMILAVTLAFSAFVPMPAKAAQSDIISGMELSKNTLVMKTGGTKTLSVTFTPSDLTDSQIAQLGITWESSDTDVVTVEADGTTATVTAKEGSGGTARITVEAGGFKATCDVLVTVRENLLEDIIFLQGSNLSNRYDATEGVQGSWEYTVRVPENVSSMSILPILCDDAGDDATITVRYTDIKTGEEVVIDAPTDEITPLTKSGAMFGANDLTPFDFTIEAADKTRTETYVVHVRRGTYMGDMKIYDSDGDRLDYTPSFAYKTYSYSVHVPSSQKTLELELSARESSNTSFTVDGNNAPDGKYTLELSGSDRTVVLTAGDGSLAMPFEYTLEINVDTVYVLTLSSNAESPVFAIYDSSNVRVYPEPDGTYELIGGEDYTYTASAAGYVSKSGSINISADKALYVELEKSVTVNPDEVSAQWGAYFKTQENMNIVGETTPASSNNAAVRWSAQYGAGDSATASISEGILIGDYLCCFYGNKLMYLDAATGKTVREVTMKTTANSSFAKPIYGGGMVFVPLSDGRIQAFDANTLESLWVFYALNGGYAASALRYDSGYLYAGFTGGDLACISTEDVDYSKTDEEKSAVWINYDSGGYYRTGFYTTETSLFAGSQSPTIYCLDKKTGIKLAQAQLPSGYGAVSTAISYYDGRIYFATEYGYLCSYAIKEADGNDIIDVESLESIKVGGTISGTPVIYGGRAYVGTAAYVQTGLVMEDSSPYYMNVIDIGSDGVMSVAYRMELDGFAEGAPTLSTAYEDSEGLVYVYFTTDTSNGKVYLLKDAPGLDGPADGSGIFYQQQEVSGLGSSSIAVGGDGVMYFMYGSSYMYAIEATDLYLNGISVTNTDAKIDDGTGVFDAQADTHTVVVDYGVEYADLVFDINDDVSISVDGTEGDSFRAYLMDGAATVTVELSKDGATRTYVINVRTLYSDTSIGDISVSGTQSMSVLSMELDPPLSDGIYNYKSEIYGTGRTVYYVWPKIKEGSGSTLKVTAYASVSGVADGEKISSVPVMTDGGQIRDRYEVTCAADARPVVAITVTAEDGVHEQTYLLELGTNNAEQTLSTSSESIVQRKPDSVTFNIDVAQAGYLYYLEDDPSSTEMPQASTVRSNGKRININAGANTVTVDGLGRSKTTLWLYAMSYAQRFSIGIRLDVPQDSDADHDFILTGSQDADCVNAGSLTYTCSDCGYSYSIRIAPLGHDVAEYTSNNDATYDADGTKSGVCSRCGQTITVTDEGSKLSEDLKESFVRRLYRVCLGREADDGGLADHIALLESGKNGGTQTAYEFLFSEEFKNKNYCNEDFLKYLYSAMFDREADSEGLNAWLGILEGGGTREEVFNGFAQSDEFKKLCALAKIKVGDSISVPEYGTVPKGVCAECGKKDGVTSFVERLYEICLGRDADSAGLSGWTGLLWSHKNTGAATADGFFLSREYTQAAKSDSDYINDLYMTYLGRAPEDSGTAWLASLARGESREDIRKGFAYSVEFDALCKKYGINAT